MPEIGEHGALVFGDERRRRTLEGIVHPAVLVQARHERERIRREDERAIVLSDIPLLFEVGMQGLFDLILLIYTPPETQILRAMRRNGLTRDEAAARLGAQMPIGEKLALADIVIRNDGTMKELRARVDEVWQELLLREREKRQ